MQNHYPALLDHYNYQIHAMLYSSSLECYHNFRPIATNLFCHLDY